MENIIKHLDKLSTSSNKVKLYKEFGPNVILHHCGKIVEEVDKQYIEFLKITNGAYILGWVFLGLKNRELSENVYDFMRNLYDDNYILCSQFWGFARNEKGQVIGYLKIKDARNNHFIGYYDPITPEEIFIISSSFNIFIEKFLVVAENALTSNEKISYLKEDFLLNSNDLIVGDLELQDYMSKHGNSLIYRL